jgi:hypothetical protein
VSAFTAHCGSCSARFPLRSLSDPWECPLCSGEAQRQAERQAQKSRKATAKRKATRQRAAAALRVLRDPAEWCRDCAEGPAPA